MNSKQRLIAGWRIAGINPRLLAAFEAVPREHFVMPGMKREAYADAPLPTLRNQSISQPSTIMLMLQALGLNEGDRVFELGAGVGYQAALMSKLVGRKGRVFSTEIIPELVAIAQQNMDELGLSNVSILERDGSCGHKSEAPYDKAIITAACPDIPKPIIDQVKVGGAIIAPVGDMRQQTMIKAVKKKQGLDLEFLGPFMFVPMKGRFGFEELEIYY